MAEFLKLRTPMPCDRLEAVRAIVSEIIARFGSRGDGAS